MCGPPDPEMRRAALAGSPLSQSHNSSTKSSLAPSDYQAQKLRRLLSLCHATACTIASLAWGGRAMNVHVTPAQPKISPVAVSENPEDAPARRPPLCY
jgi:hypothetical protein